MSGRWGVVLQRGTGAAGLRLPISPPTYASLFYRVLHEGERVCAILLIACGDRVRRASVLPPPLDVRAREDEVAARPR